MISKNKSYTRKALSFSLILLIVWGFLGAGTTLAWFTDTTPIKKNTFYIGELDLVVSYKNEEGKYVELDDTVSLFNNEALYEPGYVEVVYLKIENLGDIVFDYIIAVTANDYTTSINKYGQEFSLIPYLYHGIVIADTDEQLTELLSTREKASIYADTVLNTYNIDTDYLNVNEEKYMALIVRMPESVGNEANHTGKAPMVELGISVKASQRGTLQ